MKEVNILTLKRLIPIIALLIPTFLKGGEGGLLTPSLAYGYTYQDVLDEYEEAKRQYPDDLIWMEEVTTDAGKGYRILKRENCNISGRVFSDYIFNKLNPIIWNFYLADSQNADGSWNYLSMLEICASQWEIYRVSCFENCSTGIDSSSC